MNASKTAAIQTTVIAIRAGGRARMMADRGRPCAVCGAAPAAPYFRHAMAASALACEDDTAEYVETVCDPCALAYPLVTGAIVSAR